MATMTTSPRSGLQPVTRFDELFTRFYPELFGLVYRVVGERMEAEDVLQDAFLKLADEPELQTRPDAEVGAWLRHVGMNLAFNRVRSSRRGRARIERVGRMERGDAVRGHAAVAVTLLRNLAGTPRMMDEPFDQVEVVAGLERREPTAERPL